ncbi:neuromodulin [Ictidomys tridecemlineatus]
MLSCLRTKAVGKIAEDQKIEQDRIKPEDRAQRAATQIQARFRGYLTRKRLRGEKKGDAQAAEAKAKEKEEGAPAADGVGTEEAQGPAAEEVPATGPEAQEPGKAGDTPSQEKQAQGAPDGALEQAATPAPAPSEEMDGSAEMSADNSPSSRAEDVPAKEEPQPADDVPAAATTPAAEDPAVEATAQPRTEPAESS